MRLLFYCLITVIALNLSFAALGQPGTQQRIPFKHGWYSVATGDPLAQVSAVLDTDNVQRLSSGGIHFVVELFNNGDQAVTVKNPLDFLTYLLLDQDGTPLQLPPRGVRFLIKTYRPLETQAFRVVGLELNGESVTERNQSKEIVTLPGGAVYRMSLVIEKVRASASDSAAVPITADEYVLTVVLGLVDADGEGYLQFDSPAVKVSLEGNG